MFFTVNVPPIVNEPETASLSASGVPPLRLISTSNAPPRIADATDSVPMPPLPGATVPRSQRLARPPASWFPPMCRPEQWVVPV
jgi:hypothetical protein